MGIVFSAALPAFNQLFTLRCKSHNLSSVQNTHSLCRAFLPHLWCGSAVTCPSNRSVPRVGSPNHQVQNIRLCLVPKPWPIQHQGAHRHHCDGQDRRMGCLLYRRRALSGRLLQAGLRIRLRGYGLPLHPTFGLCLCWLVQTIPRVAVEHDLAWRRRQLGLVQHTPQDLQREEHETHVPPAFLRPRCRRQLCLVLVPRLYFHRLVFLQLGVLDCPKQRRGQHPLWCQLRFGDGRPHFRLVLDFVHRKPPDRPRKSRSLFFFFLVAGPDRLSSGGPR